jgi:glycosyltransferase involved in cell wall biosynthesis
MTKKNKIAFLCTGNPEDKKIWSGTIFKMYQALLQHGFEVEWIEIGKYSEFQITLFSKIEKGYKKIFRRGFNKNHFLLKAYFDSNLLTKKLKKSSADLVFAPTYISELAFVETKKPILYLNDATFHQLLNYYAGMSGFGFISKKITVWVEKLALKKANFLVFSSHWAAKHAIEFYKISEKKIKVIHFGSNSDAPQKIVEKSYNNEIIFLFLGVEWERKGGQIALDAIKILRKKNYPVRLQVVGCTPPVSDTEVMNVIPFLNKNNPEEAQQITHFLQHSHFMLMPTRADCTPISFCEAASYGLPVISTDTGGVSSVVVSGNTGLLLSHSADAKDYANQIETLLNQPDKIKKLAQNARKKYEQELNWKVWGNKMKEMINLLLVEKKYK